MQGRHQTFLAWGMFIFLPMELLPRKLTWLDGKTPFLIEDISSNGWFCIAMLVFHGFIFILVMAKDLL